MTTMPAASKGDVSRVATAKRCVAAVAFDLKIDAAQFTANFGQQGAKLDPTLGPNGIFEDRPDFGLCAEAMHGGTHAQGTVSFIG